MCTEVLSIRSCPTLCDPMDWNPPGSSVHGILQTRLLQWVAMISSRVSSQPRDQTHNTCISFIGSCVLLPLAPELGPKKCSKQAGFIFFRQTNNTLVRN